MGNAAQVCYQSQQVDLALISKVSCCKGSASTVGYTVSCFADSLLLFRYLAFAVNYFIGSGPFVRALRYWANTATTDLAKARESSATGFKLSDTILVPMIGQPKQRTAAGQVKAVDVLVPPGIDCADETQIFKALGLAYVPAYMRYFGTNFQ